MNLSNGESISAIERKIPHFQSTGIHTCPRVSRVPQVRNKGLGLSYISTDNTIESGSSVELVRQVLTPELLEDVRSIWFSTTKNAEDVVNPCEETMMQWFRSSDEFDRHCSTKLRPALDKTRDSGISPEDVLNAVRPSAPEDWLALVLLFDQMTRNIYRGDEAAFVFKIFDPIAREVAWSAANNAIVHLSPHFRYRIGYRLWMFMPLMHSEDLKLHEKAVNLIQEMVGDYQTVQEQDHQDVDDEDFKFCKSIVIANRECALKTVQSQLEAEKAHKDLIERFGRYPHRNGPLGREPTPEETKFLEGGGATFGSKPGPAQGQK